MSRWNLIWLLVVPACVALGVVVTANAPPPDQDYQRIRTLVDVLGEVEQSYVRELSDADKKKLVEDMINGGLSQLDPNSQFFNEDELSAFDTQTEGEFGGVGIQITKDPVTSYLKVESPMPGTPAYNAGILAGDFITQVDGVAIGPLSMTEARNKIAGKPNTQVKLTVLREGTAEPKEFTLTRALIEVHPVIGYRRDPADPTKWIYFADKAGGIAFIRLTIFNEKSDKELKEALLKVEAEGARALILDLRGNPGGLLTQAIAIADLFLDDGVIVSTKGRRPSRSWSAGTGDTLFLPAAKKPIVVLMNRASASASEILAAALQDHARAVVVGERSFGKGSVQRVIELPDRKSALKLTTEIWLTPNGKNLHRWPDSKETDEWGVKPNPGLEVKLTDEQILDYLKHIRSLDIVKGKPGMEPAPAPTVKDEKKDNDKVKDKEIGPKKPYSDPVVDKALDYLKGKLKEVGGVFPALPHRMTA